MKKVLLLFWGKGGNVERAARKVYALFPPDQIDIFDVAGFDVSTITNYNLIILGGSTVGVELWTDVKDDNEWNRFFRAVENTDLSGKQVAFFGLGDQVLYPDHYVDALGIFKEEMAKTGATHIGEWPTEGYRFTGSDGAEGDQFFGLALDEDRQAELTDERIKKWTDMLKKEVGI
ncbi:MAG TPA: flavodoxin [Bacteroidetes bacterium]|nr:flavodoxin [Bacteroidota bacterium]